MRRDLDGGRREAAGGSAAAEFRRRTAGQWWREPVSRVLAVSGLVAVALLVLRGRADGFAVVASAVAAGAMGLARRVRPERDPERWLRGAEGERSTAELLNALPRRFGVRHDLAVPGSRANIDHLVIGPSGVFVIDTKAYRSRLRVRRGRAWAGSRAVDTASVAWQAERLEQALGVTVVPVVAIHGSGPGSGLRRRGVVDGGVRVLPASRLVRAVSGRRSFRRSSRLPSRRPFRRPLRRLRRSEVRAVTARADELLQPAAGRLPAGRVRRA